jgi:hypothetical protein
MATKRTKKSKKLVTLSEFRAWLEGVEELQSVDWCPTSDQWKLIRSKIDSIVETEVEVPVSHPQAPQISQVLPQTPPPGPIPRQGPPPGPSSLPPAGPFIPPDVEISPAAKAMMGGTSPSQLLPDASGKLKTPNIDTTNGDYNSGFE